MRRRNAAIIVATLALCTPAPAQEFDDSGPNGPRTSQSDDAARREINRLKAIIAELEREIAALKAKAGNEEEAAKTGAFAGIWFGTASCGRRQFAVTFDVTEEIGRIGKGKWTYTGAATGSDDAQISPMPTRDSPDSYAIVTARPDTYDYIVAVDGNRITGKATRYNCQLYLERG